MGNENSNTAVNKHPTKKIKPMQKPSLIYPMVYPGVYIPATVDYPGYTYNYPAHSNGTEYYSQSSIELVNKAPEESKQTHHHHHHSPHRHHHHHHHSRHHHHRHHQQQDRNEHASQTTPSLLVGINDLDQRPRATSVLRRGSLSSDSFDEYSEFSLVYPSVIGSPKKSSSSIVDKKLTSSITVKKHPPSTPVILRSPPNISKRTPAPRSNITANSKQIVSN